MRPIVPLVAAVALLVVGSIASGQAPIEKQAPPATSTVQLSMEQRHVIREIVKDLDISPAASATPTTVGAKVPQQVELHPIPADIAGKVPQIKSHVFFVKDNQIVLVDPKDNTVAEVID